jgi:cell division protein FtsB
MIARRRIRAALTALGIYATLGAASAYLVWGAKQGEHGLFAMAGYQTELADLDHQLAALKQEHEAWQRRVKLMSGDMVSKDLLEEQAHLKLDRIGKNEVVVLLAPDQRVSR